MNCARTAPSGPTGSLCRSAGLDAGTLVFDRGLKPLGAVVGSTGFHGVRLPPTTGVRVALSDGPVFQATEGQFVWACDSSAAPPRWTPASKLTRRSLVALALGGAAPHAFGSDPLDPDDARALGILAAGGFLDHGALQVLVLREEPLEVADTLRAFLQRNGGPSRIGIKEFGDGGYLLLEPDAVALLRLRFRVLPAADGSLSLPPRLRNVPLATAQVFLEGALTGAAFALNSTRWRARQELCAWMAVAGRSPACFSPVNAEAFARGARRPAAPGSPPSYHWSRVRRAVAANVLPVAVCKSGPFVAQSVVFGGAEVRGAGESPPGRRGARGGRSASTAGTVNSAPSRTANGAAPRNANLLAP